MTFSTRTPPTHRVAREEETPFWQRLLYRWFVEYNPLYLVSAALVLVGCFVWSSGLVQQDGLGCLLEISAVAELYSAALLGGAALLTRIGLRRPAVMLALLFVLFQWDATLHLETSAYLGSMGAWTAALWFACFAGKLYAVEKALRIRLEWNVVVAALVAALGLALGPQGLYSLGGRNAGALLAAWLFALGSLYRRDGITSTEELGAWGHAVLRRVTRAVWPLSAVLVGIHVLMACRDHDLSLSAALLAAPLLAVRRVRSELRMWAIVLGTLVFAAAVQPDAFFVTSLLAAAALCLRALFPIFSEATHPAHANADTRPGVGPYRASWTAADAAGSASIGVTSPDIGPTERARSFGGAIFAVYLAAWTLRWSHGSWPAHVAELDLALTVAVAVAVWRTRVRSLFVPLAASYGHFVVQARLLPKPSSSAGWGETFVAFGFALLVGSLFTSYRLRGLAARVHDG